MELPAEAYAKVRPLFTGPLLTLVVDAVLMRNSPARIWVDDADRPGSALLWDKAGSYYLAGDAANTEFNAGVSAFVARQISQGCSYFKILYGSKAWEKWIPNLFSGTAPVKRQRELHVLKRARIPGWRDRLPPGFRVQPIEAALLRAERIKNREAVADEICSCWIALEDFLERGFGRAILRGDEIVCWCTAECVSQGKCGIGIETLAEYQGRGLATLAAGAFVEQALSRAITPHWDAWADNVASLAVARKVGFEKLLDYSVYLGKIR
jgi:GNAT superfamily N-acetyltransferase